MCPHIWNNNVNRKGKSLTILLHDWTCYKSEMTLLNSFEQNCPLPLQDSSLLKWREAKTWGSFWSILKCRHQFTALFMWKFYYDHPRDVELLIALINAPCQNGLRTCLSILKGENMDFKCGYEKVSVMGELGKQCINQWRACQQQIIREYFGRDLCGKLE